MRNFRVLLLFEHEHMGRFSNLHRCTFKGTYIIEFAEKEAAKEKNQEIIEENVTQKESQIKITRTMYKGQTTLYD